MGRKTKIQMKRNETKRLLDLSYNTKENVIKISTANTFEHELAKFLLCWEAACDGKRFVTEAIFKNGKRADILVLDDQEAWEVLHTETNKRFTIKGDEYPVPVLPFKSKKIIDHWMKRIYPVPIPEEDEDGN